MALAVAMGIRTFFLQPFKIPTGSMQPTLFGVTSTPDFGPVYTLLNLNADQATVHKAYEQQMQLQKSMVIPTGLEAVKQWFEGASYVHVVAQDDGVIKKISPITKLLIFNIKQSLWIGSTNDDSPASSTRCGFRRILANRTLRSAPVCFPASFITRATTW